MQLHGVQFLPRLRDGRVELGFLAPVENPDSRPEHGPWHARLCPDTAIASVNAEHQFT